LGANPKVHESVLKRIQNNAHVYAPIGIPHDYSVVVTVPDATGSGATFRIDSLPKTADAGAPHVYETRDDTQARVFAERDEIWPLVQLRALLYFLTLLATLFFVVFPLTGRPDPLGEKLNAFKWVSELIRAVGGSCPAGRLHGSSPTPNTRKRPDVRRHHFGAVYCRYQSRSSDQRQRWLPFGSAIRHKLPVPAKPLSTEPSTGEMLLMGVRSTWKDYLGPALFAIAIMYLGLTVGNRLLFTALDDAGLVCKNTENLSYLPERRDGTHRRGGCLSYHAPTRGLIDVRSPLLAPKCVAFRSASRMFGRYPHLFVRSIPRGSQSKTVDVARTTVLKAGHTIYQFPFAAPVVRVFHHGEAGSPNQTPPPLRRSCASGMQRKNAAEVPA
jgi:hypothetical protein